MLGWANSKPWIWAWMVAELVSPPALQHPPQQSALQRCLPRLLSLCCGWQGAGSALPPSCPRAGSPVPMPLKPALLCCPGEVQALLSQELQLVRDWESSRPGVQLSQLLREGGKGQRDGDESLNQFSHHLHPKGPLHCDAPSKGISLPVVAACERWGRLSRVSQLVRGRASSV